MIDEKCLQRVIRFLEQCHDELVTCIGSIHEEQEEYTVYEIEVRSFNHIVKRMNDKEECIASVLQAISSTSDIPLTLRDKLLLRLSDDLRDALITISNSEVTSDTAYFTLYLDEASDVLVLREGPNSDYKINTLEICLSHELRTSEHHIYQVLASGQFSCPVSDTLERTKRQVSTALYSSLHAKYISYHIPIPFAKVFLFVESHLAAVMDYTSSVSMEPLHLDIRVHHHSHDMPALRDVFETALRSHAELPVELKEHMLKYITVELLNLTVATFTPVAPGEIKHHTLHFITDPYDLSFAVDEHPKEGPNRMHMVISEKAQRLCPCHIFFLALTGDFEKYSRDEEKYINLKNLISAYLI